jgi:hypothetical protein
LRHGQSLSVEDNGPATRANGQSIGAGQSSDRAKTQIKLSDEIEGYFPVHAQAPRQSE